MKQQEALEQVQQILAGRAVRLSRMHSTGVKFGHEDAFYIWDHTDGDCIIVARSEHSWEHAISKIEADRIEATTPADHSSVDEEVSL